MARFPPCAAIRTVTLGKRRTAGVVSPVELEGSAYGFRSMAARISSSM
jgi:hypothetical protein